ncbi:hypothetical protein D2T81_11665 [Azospirillum brasilense]|nr:hypothetical protein D2T81_11665 [Azospirillum brasilense]
MTAPAGNEQSRKVTKQGRQSRQQPQPQSRCTGAGVDPAEIVAKELSLGGVQRPITADIVGGDAIEWFRFGEFAGWLLEGVTEDQGAAPG